MTPEQALMLVFEWFLYGVTGGAILMITFLLYSQWKYPL